MECPNRNKFCVVCGLFVPNQKSRKITKTFVECYEQYFLINFVPKVWYQPEVVCGYCYRGILGSNSVNRHQHPMKYVYPVIWMNRSEHAVESCYFCQSQPLTTNLKYKFRHKIQYHSCDSVKPAVLRSRTNPSAPSEEQIPDAVEEHSLCADNDIEDISEYQPINSEFGFAPRHFITQADFDDLVRDIGLTKTNSEILASRLQQWRLVSEDFRVTSSRKRSKQLSFDECFKVDDQSGITYAVDIENLFEIIGHPYNPDEWRLFIDGSVKSLKGVLLHNGNAFPSVPIVYGTDVKETYANMRNILKLINYDLHGWVICCDLKVVAIITGLKKGFSKHQCFLCLWEGRHRELHYTDHEWQPRITHKLGENSIDHMPLVPSSKIILPPLHIKLGLIRNFIRALPREGEAMMHLKTIFPKLSNAKIDAGKLNRYVHINLKAKNTYFFRCT